MGAVDGCCRWTDWIDRFTLMHLERLLKRIMFCSLIIDMRIFRRTVSIN
jgi:hypothetical protein